MLRTTSTSARAKTKPPSKTLCAETCCASPQDCLTQVVTGWGGPACAAHRNVCVSCNSLCLTPFRFTNLVFPGQFSLTTASANATRLGGGIGLACSSVPDYLGPPIRSAQTFYRTFRACQHGPTQLGSTSTILPVTGSQNGPSSFLARPFVGV